jgi:hypothetical protein
MTGRGQVRSHPGTPQFFRSNVSYTNPYEDWTPTQWEQYQRDRAKAYKDRNGYAPIKSQICIGCVSWPYAMCLACYDETEVRRKAHYAIYYGDEGNW